MILQSIRRLLSRQVFVLAFVSLESVCTSFHQINDPFKSILHPNWDLDCCTVVQELSTELRYHLIKMRHESLPHHTTRREVSFLPLLVLAILSPCLVCTLADKNAETIAQIQKPIPSEAMVVTFHGSAPALSSLFINPTLGTLYLRICRSTVIVWLCTPPTLKVYQNKHLLIVEEPCRHTHTVQRIQLCERCLKLLRDSFQSAETSIKL